MAQGGQATTKQTQPTDNFGPIQPPTQTLNTHHHPPSTQESPQPPNATPRIHHPPKNLPTLPTQRPDARTPGAPLTRIGLRPAPFIYTFPVLFLSRPFLLCPVLSFFIPFLSFPFLSFPPFACVWELITSHCNLTQTPSLSASMRQCELALGFRKLFFSKLYPYPFTSLQLQII